MSRSSNLDLVVRLGQVYFHTKITLGQNRQTRQLITHRCELHTRKSLPRLDLVKSFSFSLSFFLNVAKKIAPNFNLSTMNGAASFGRKSFGRLNLFADSCTSPSYDRTFAIGCCATKCLSAKCFLTEGRGIQQHKTNFVNNHRPYFQLCATLL